MKSATAPPRRKSATSSKLVILKVPSASLRRIVEPKTARRGVKQESPAKDIPELLKPPVTAPTKVEAPAESPTHTSNAVDTPGATSTSMPPPTEGVKKKGVKQKSGHCSIDVTSRMENMTWD